MDWQKVNALANVLTAGVIIGFLIGVSLAAKAGVYQDEPPCVKRAREAAERKAMRDNVD